jgi:hypothetical protein
MRQVWTETGRPWISSSIDLSGAGHALGRGRVGGSFVEGGQTACREGQTSMGGDDVEAAARPGHASFLTLCASFYFFIISEKKSYLLEHGMALPLPVVPTFPPLLPSSRCLPNEGTNNASVQNYKAVPKTSAISII